MITPLKCEFFEKPQPGTLRALIVAKRNARYEGAQLDDPEGVKRYEAYAEQRRRKVATTA